MRENLPLCLKGKFNKRIDTEVVPTAITKDGKEIIDDISFLNNKNDTLYNIKILYINLKMARNLNVLKEFKKWLLIHNNRKNGL